MCGRFTPVTHDELESIVREIERERAASRGDAGPVLAAPIPVRGRPFQPAAQEEPSQPSLFDIAPDRAPSSASSDAFPKSVVPVIVEAEASLQIAYLTWGYQASWSASPVFNARVETALGTGANMWAESLRARRCIVASHGFYEPHATETRVNPKTGRSVKRQYRFTAPDDDVLYLAGVWQDDRFSVMTCTPNRWVQSVHDRMPVVLRANELIEWLDGDYARLFDRSGVILNVQAL